MTRPTPDDVEHATKLLAKAALLDPRISAGDEGTILAWAEVLTSAPTLTLDDLLPAVATHYATSCDRVMPADVLRLARAAKRDRIDRTLGNDTAPPAPQLPPATIDARRLAIAAATAKIGADHDPDTRRTFDEAPTPPKAVSQATIAAKVARIRAAAPPDPLPPDRPVIDAEISCDWHLDDRHCLLAANHLGPHHPSKPKAAR